MENFNILKLSKSILITIPTEWRNRIWSEKFGKIQQELRDLDKEKEEIIIDASKCNWIDPLPMLSLIIALGEIESSLITKKIYLPEISNCTKEQKRLLAYLNKEGFLEALQNNTVEILFKEIDKEDTNFNNEHVDLLIEYEKYLTYYDCTLLKANVIDLSNDTVKKNGVEHFIDNELENIKHRFLTKINTSNVNDTFNKISLFLKETIENVYEHAYEKSSKKYVGYYVRYRHGLADSTLDDFSREELKKSIDLEHNSSPRLQKWFIEDISNFIEVFVIDSGFGLTVNYFKNKKVKHILFREAWRETIGLGLRGGVSPKKNTEFGGLYTLNRLCLDNYLTARDHTEWLGDKLPIQGENPEIEANKSYLNIDSQNPIKGLALIGRISWRSLTDESTSWLKLKDIFGEHLNNNINNPFSQAIIEPRDIYLKYYGNDFKSIKQKPIYVIDERFNTNDIMLKKEYFHERSVCDFFHFIPQERLSKNKIFDIIYKHIKDVIIKSKSIIISDIAVWEANVFQLALENAKYSKDFLSKIDDIVLVTRRLSVCILKKTKDTYKSNKTVTKDFIISNPLNFSPNLSLYQLIELVRTHDSMIYWQHIKNSNKYGEYFINEEIVWYQDEKDIGLKGYLNFAKTLTDNFCTKIYEFSLERSLSLANEHGCLYKSIDVLTKNLSTAYNSIFYNSNNKNSQKILLGSVFVSGYSERASEVGQETKNTNYKVHYFHNQNVKSKVETPVAQLLLWPVKGENWFNENIDPNKINTENSKKKYRRVGTSHVIAPYGWKYFPIPRYKLYNKKSNEFLREYTIEQVNSVDYEFKSVYKRAPRDTYYDWQGKRTQLLSIGHISYESNHDLLNIDFRFVVNESFLIGGKLSQFLTAEFLIGLGCNYEDLPNIGNDKLVNGVKNYIESEYVEQDMKLYESAVIVYPYHFNADYIVSVIKEYIPTIFHDRIIALFPLNKERSDTTFLISPLTIETIKEKIKEYKLVNPENHINVLLFDDATIAGKTRKELKHILFSLGTDNIRTITILERRRLPFNTSDPRFNKAYWRLDIPKLGAVDTCPICVSIKILKDFQNFITSENIINRVSKVSQIWQESTPFDFNKNQVIRPVNIELPRKEREKKFGIYHNGVEFLQCGGESNKIEISNSLGLSIYVSELHSMTSRDDIVFQYITNDKISYSAKIEMLSTYLLLFGKELSNITQEKVIKELFILCKDVDNNNHTSYALIALLSQGYSKLEFLYNVCKDEGESDIRVGNIDMLILCAVLSINSTSNFSKSSIIKRLKKGYANLKDLYKQFHSEIYNDYGVTHDTPLQLIVKKECSLKVLRESEDSCDKFMFLLNEIPIWYYRSNGEYNLSELIIKKVVPKLKKYKFEASKNDKTNNIDDFNTVRALANEVFLLMKPIHEKLFVCIGLRTEGFPVKTRFVELIESCNSVAEIGLSSNFIKLPISDDTLQLERWITWDRNVERKMDFLLNNVKYASEKIIDPYSDSPIKKDGWVSIEYFESENRLEILIFNKSNKSSKEVVELTKQKIKPEKLHLKELEISINYEDVKLNQQDILKTRISFPYI